MNAAERCGNEFPLKHGYFCELPKGHAGEHEVECPNAQFHQRWPNVVNAAEEMRAAKREHCHAGKDGDCNWKDCPQEANNRANYQDYCPLAAADDAEEEETI